MGLFSKKKPKFKAPKLSKEGGLWQGRLDDWHEQGMSGEGLMPQSLSTKAYQSSMGAIGQGFMDSMRGIESYIERFVPTSDDKVRDYLRNRPQRERASAEAAIKQQDEMQKGQDEQAATQMALEELGVAQDYGLQATNTYNQALKAADQIPSQGMAFMQGMAPGLGTTFGNMFSGQQAPKTTSTQQWASNQGYGPQTPQAAINTQNNVARYGTASPSWQQQASGAGYGTQSYWASPYIWK